MFAKLLTLIIVAGLTALALLLTRQEQIDTVHDITQLHHRIQQQRHAVWSIRNEIARACRPSVIEKFRAQAPDLWVDLSIPQPLLPPLMNQEAGPVYTPPVPLDDGEPSHGG